MGKVYLCFCFLQVKTTRSSKGGDNSELIIEDMEAKSNTIRAEVRIGFHGASSVAFWLERFSLGPNGRLSQVVQAIMVLSPWTLN